MVKNLKYSLLLLLVSVLLTAIVALTGFNLFMDRYGDSYYIGEAFFKNNVLHAGLLSVHDSHPTRGWVPKPHLQLTDPNIKTNDRGWRSLQDYAYQPDKFTVLIVGDSFTYGVGVDDAHVWPTLLQDQEPRLHVLNLGVSGYGIDQMLITERETIEE